MDQYRIFLFLVLFSTGISYPVSGDPGEKAEVDSSIVMVDFDQFEPWLYRHTDSVYVINFWATWCAPCIREIPYFEKINEVYSGQKVKVLLVSLDFPNQIDSRVIPFIERNNVKSEVILLDDPFSNRWIPKVDESWSGAIPATVIYSKEKRLFFEKEFKYDELEDIVTSFLTIHPKP